MPKYTVCTPIKHDGKKYAVGASIDLTKAEAEALPDGAVDQPRAGDLAARKAAEQAEAAQKAEADRHAAEQAEADRKSADQLGAGNGGALG